MNVLFIGNSFTYFNNMPEEIFRRIACENGDDVTVYSVTKGGARLERFLDEADEYGERVSSLLREVAFDVAVLQEQSHTPISDPDSFFTSVRDFSRLLRERGISPYLYSTWGYHPTKSQLSLYGADTEDMERRLRAAYTAIGGEVGATVCPVGAAMTYAFKHSTLDLYRPDGYHPEPCASVLAALVIYSVISGKGIEDTVLPFDFITPEEKRQIKEAAAFALR